jgi:hypothetical protein
MHNITTHRCEVTGDEAHAESYVLVALLASHAPIASVMCGRYLDRLVRRDGTWRIAVRRATVELAFTADASFVRSDFFATLGYAKGTRDGRDSSYARPLTADVPTARW